MPGAEALNQGTSAFICNTLGNCTTIFVVVMAWVFLHEKTSARALVGVAICLAGVFIIGADELGGGVGGSALGIALIMTSAVLNAGNQVFARAVRKELDLLPLLGVDYCLGTIITGVYGLLTGADFRLNLKAVFYMAILSWFCTLFCHTTPIWAMKYINVVTASVINLAGPFITAIVAFFLLGEVPKPMTYVGAAVMIARFDLLCDCGPKGSSKAMEASRSPGGRGSAPVAVFAHSVRKLPWGCVPRGVLLFVLVICAPPTSAERSG